jgi:hypothetical protein
MSPRLEDVKMARRVEDVIADTPEATAAWTPAPALERLRLETQDALGALVFRVNLPEYGSEELTFVPISLIEAAREYLKEQGVWIDVTHDDNDTPHLASGTPAVYLQPPRMS